MREWLKWIFAEREMLELERWRVEWQQSRQWLSEFKHVAMALDNMKAIVDGKLSLDACYPPGDVGPWTIDGLREVMRKIDARHACNSCQGLQVGPYDLNSDTILIEGTQYSGCLFRDGYGFNAMVGQVHRIDRNKDGVVTITRLQNLEAVA